MEVKPFEYQENGINEILEKFKTNQRVLYQLSTGGGKTFIFCFLTKKWIEQNNKKILILCHRTELIDQTIKSMIRIGVTCEAVTSKVKELNHSSDCYVAMVETAHNRLVKNPYFFKDVGLVIADECHILIFDKVFNFFPDSKILGCTATPVVFKRERFYRCKFCKKNYLHLRDCCNHEVLEYTKPYPMSNIYQDIVLGPKITELIDMNRLVKEISFVKKYVNTNDLKTDSTGEFTNESLDVAYGNSEAVFNVLKNYKELCFGKKTIIFNNSSTTNLLVYEKFKADGLNVRMFDSVNKEQSGNREDIIEWFRNERDAILCNVSVFTTGFDVTDVEAVILNRATNSLSLFLQMVGRGVRITNNIFKDKLILIDGGENVDRHQEFSDPTRDWKMIFQNGIGKEKPKKEDSMDVSTCLNCGALYMKSEPECPICGFKIVEERNRTRVDISEEVLQPITEIPPPNGEAIYKYTLSLNEDVNFAFKILINQIIDMFIFYRVDKQKYINTKENGKLIKSITKLIKQPYHILIMKNDIRASNNRTKQYIINKVLTKLENYYEI